MQKNSKNILVWLGVATAVTLVIVVVKKSLKKTGVSIVPINTPVYTQNNNSGGMNDLNWQNGWDNNHGWLETGPNNTQIYYRGDGTYYGTVDAMGNWI